MNAPDRLVTCFPFLSLWLRGSTGSLEDDRTYWISGRLMLDELDKCVVVPVFICDGVASERGNQSDVRIRLRLYRSSKRTRLITFFKDVRAKDRRQYYLETSVGGRPTQDMVAAAQTLQTSRFV